MTTCLTLFAGGGLADIGLDAAGYQSIGGIDNDPTVREKQKHHKEEDCVI
jgi:site-specific DNA-cytosine methylase